MNYILGLNENLELLATYDYYAAPYGERMR